MRPHRRSIHTSALVALAFGAALLACVARTAPVRDADQVRAIFDGHTLDGWDGDPRFWSVADGAIVGQSTPENPLSETTYLIWRGGEVDDFELTCEFRMNGGNSGVQFRSRDLGGHRVAGYQADLEEGPNWTGCLYEQEGRGTVATRGERVVLEPGGRKAVALDDARALLALVREHDWNEYTIRAVGERIELTINGARMVEVVDRDPAHARRAGILALQLHQGAPMRVDFRNLRLRAIRNAPDIANAPVVGRMSSAHMWDGSPPQWIWAGAETPDGAVVALERRFTLPRNVKSATLRATGDDHLRVFLNDQLAVSSDTWWEPVELSVTPLVKRGENSATILVKNDASVAGAWLELVVEDAAGGHVRLLSDASWAGERLADATNLERWSPAELERARFSPAHSFGAVGVEPWESQGKSMHGESAAEEPSHALDPRELELPPGFKAELVYSVPGKEQGSWVALCADPKGRFYASDQHGSLYRIEPAPAGTDASHTHVERVAVDVGSAQGLCWAFDSLYAVVADTDGDRKPGLYRLRDTDGDGKLDTSVLLARFDGGGEHGPHGVLLGPDKRLWIVGGNHTKVPAPIVRSCVPKTWDEDALLPIIPDPNGHAVGIRAPGGWVVSTDADGKEFELFAAGLRNAYDLAFDPAGELFTFDSDMEWDIGAPWYKPTRVLHVVSGADFGWRTGSGNWPVDLPDTLPSVCDMGLSSPTGLVFGTETHFPPEYQSALFACDWAYGTIYAVHLAPRGASWSGKSERFARGKPFPVTDIIAGRDGALYVITGGRGTQSALYRITWTGAEHTESAPTTANNDSAPRSARRHLEELHVFGPTCASDLDAIASALASEDPFLAHAGRIALERSSDPDWETLKARCTDPRRRAKLVLAALHARPIAERESILRDLDTLQRGMHWPADAIELLRLNELALIRLTSLTDGERAAIRARLAPLFPSGSERVDRALAQILVYLEDPAVTGALVARLESACSQEEKIHAAYCLRVARAGWTADLRRRFFTFFGGEAQGFHGGYSLVKFVDKIRAEALDAAPEGERAALTELARAPEVASSSGPPPVAFVKRWTREDLASLVRAPLRGRSFESGRTAFVKSTCAQCHRIGGAGGATGPDLTGAGSRFSRADLLESIFEPSKVISDQYQDTEIVTREGEMYVGRVEPERDGAVRLHRLPPGEEVVEIQVAEIESRRAYPLSRMPTGLLDVLTQGEVLDLFAYVLSGANPADPAFAP